MEQKGWKGPCLVPAERAAEVDRCLLCPLALVIARPLTTLLPWGPAMSLGEGAAVPLLAAEQSTVCSIPRGGQDRTDLQLFALSCPEECENIPGALRFPPSRRVWLSAGQQVPVRNRLSGSWVGSVTYTHKQWLSKGAGLVAARESSCNA